MPVKVDLDPDGRHIRIDAEWRYKELCKSLPGAKWKDEVWRVPLSWSSCLALRSTFRTDLEIGPGLAKWAGDERVSRIDPSMSLRDIESLDDADNEDLFPHQRAGVAFLSMARRALLADEPGVGKTAQAIRGLKKLHDNGEDVFPTLIVCPNTLKKNWAREFEKWWPGVNVQVIKGTSTQRRKQFSDEEAQIFVINWESLRSHSKLAHYGGVGLKRCRDCGGEDESITITRCEVHPRELNSIDFKSVIADEIHRSKDPKSKQSRALKAASGNAEIRFALTGTPIANNVVDLWSILHWVSEENWPTKTKWIDRFVNTMMNAFGGLVVLGVKPHMEEEFYATINPHMRRMLKARVLPFLPEILTERRDVEMSAKQKKAYEQMRDSMIAELESDSGSDVVVAPSVLTQTTRLVQLANSYAETTVDEVTGEMKMILAEPSCKVGSLMEDIKSGDFGEDSVAVCAVSKQLINLLSAALTKAEIQHGLITGDQDEDERQQAIDDFQSGRTKWILFTAQAGGVGVTLTAARRLVMLQRPWSLVDYKQALDRVHRIGSEIHDSIIIMDYVTENTIEERVIQALDVKADNFDQVVRDRAKLIDILKDDKAGR